MKIFRAGLPVLLGLTAALTLLATEALAAARDTTRVSVASGGTQGDDHSWRSMLSGNGRYVAFSSRATNFVSGDTNSAEDVFVFDRQTGMTSRVSLSSAGTEADSDSSGPSISADGRYVAFESQASNLVIEDTFESDVVLRDTQANTTTLISRATDGTPGNSASGDAAISAGGRFVAFDSIASNLVLDDTNSKSDAFVRDTQSNTTIRVSVAADGTQGNNASGLPSISADGRYVAFESAANNLVTGDTNAKVDVFVRDTQAGTTTRVSVATSGTQGNGVSQDASISADGRYVVFQSRASNLVSGDTNGTWDVFVHDLQLHATTRVSVSSSGQQGDADATQPVISSGGRYVAFRSGAALVSGDTNSFADVYVRDRQTNTTTRASVATDGTQTNTGSSCESISADGRYVTFSTNDPNLVSGDTNGVTDVFLHENDMTPASLKVEPMSRHFGLVEVGKASAGRTFAVKNAGGAKLVIHAVTLQGTNPGQFQITSNTCSGHTLAPLGTCTITARFRPTSVGFKAAYISIADTAAGSPHKISLSGMGSLEQALNGGFNNYPTAAARIPTNWTATHFAAGDGKNTTYVKEGTASVKLGNTSVLTKVLTQTRSGSGAMGNSFLLSVWGRGQAIPATAGAVQAQVLLYKGSTLVQSKAVAFPNGTYSFTRKTLTFTSAGAYDRIVIKLIYSKGSGAVWFDGLSLLRGPKPDLYDASRGGARRSSAPN